MTEHDAGTPDPLAGLDFELSASLLEEGPLDMTATLVRRFAWDTMPCEGVAAMLTALGLTHGTEEGMTIDHRGSHHRMAQVLPLEGQLRAYADIIGTIVSKALLGQLDSSEMCDEHEAEFARQNAGIILSGARAIIAQLVFSGQLGPGPMAGQFQVMIVDKETGNSE